GSAQQGWSVALSADGSTALLGGDADNGGTGAAWAFTSTAAGAPAVTGVSPSSGPVGGGTSVTISGSGFTGATAVKFGATAATSFGVDSDAQITAVAPAGTGTVDVFVTTAAGRSASGPADQFTYLPVAGGGSRGGGSGGGADVIASFVRGKSVKLRGAVWLNGGGSHGTSGDRIVDYRWQVTGPDG